MKLWSLQTADTKFSEYIRSRDPLCVFKCARPSSDCSHFYERHNKATRFDPQNCDGLCRNCHLLHEGRSDAYRALKLSQLGSEGYVALVRRAYSNLKQTKAIEQCMDLLSYPHT